MKYTIQTSRGPVRFHSVGEPIVGIPVLNVRAMYLDYVNQFLTVNRFAEFYSMSRETALRIIEEGRKQHENVIRNEMESYVGRQ